MPSPARTSPRAGGVRTATIAVALVLAPVLTLAEHLLLDPLSDDDSATQLGLQATHHAQYVAGNLAGLVGAVFFVPALIGFFRLVRGRGAGLANAGGVAFTIGIAGAAAMYGAGLLLARVAQVAAGGAQASMVEVVDHGGAGLAVILVMLMAGTALGLWLLAGALWRSRMVPRWVPVAMALTPLLDFAGTSAVLGAVAWGLLTVALAAVARVVIVAARAGEADDVGAPALVTA